MGQSYVEGIKTRFVQDRLQETSWGNREYISALKFLERWHSRPPEAYRGWADRMMYSAVKRDYPLQDECIRKEVQEGTYTQPEEFRRLVAEWREEQRRKKAESKRRQREHARQEREWLEEERRKWLETGGKP